MPHPLIFNNAIANTLLVQRVPLRFDDAAEYATFDATAFAGSRTLTAIIAGELYEADPADLTSVSDGAWVLVSTDGLRMKKVAGAPFAVQSTTLVAAPALAPGIYGQAWVLTAAPTGAWAGRARQIAIATAAGWRFISPLTGMIVRSAATGSFWSYTEAGAWVEGLGAPTAGSVAPGSLAMPFGLIAQSRTTTTPPTSGSSAWIVPPGSTGAWAGQANRIAIGPAGGWSFLAPQTGALVPVLDEEIVVRWSGAAWSATAAAPLPQARRVANAGGLNVTGNFGAAGQTAPNTGNTTLDLSASWTARAAGNLIVVRWTCADGECDHAHLFVGGAAVAAATSRFARTLEFVVPAASTAATSYAVRLSDADGQVTITGRSLLITEMDPI
jgi:hypothetical protein